MTYVEGLYKRRHIKQVESTEDYLNRVTKAYNEIDKLIGKLMKSCLSHYPKKYYLGR